MKKTYIITLYLLLGFIFFFAFVYNLGSYPLLDVDETRYVNMSKIMYNTHDFLTLYLNGDYFFEKPPLFFWIECLSFKFSGVISEFSARLPIVLLSLLPVGLLLSLCKKIKDDKFAFISTATLLTCLQYILITKIAILDSVLTSFVVSSVLCYFFTHFVEDKNKKYFWILTYVFSALAVLAKGIPGIAIPMIVVAISSIVFKTYKETVKYSWGILLFLLISMPWHLIMLKIHGSLFFDEYIVKHHILRFLGSEIIHRNEPVWFYFVTLVWGLFPHIFLLLSQIPKIKFIKFNLHDGYSKFLILNFIAALSIILFFSASSAKLITYILPVYPFMSVLIGDLWFRYIRKNDYFIRNSLILSNSILLLAMILFCFSKFVLPEDVYQNFLPIQVISLILVIPFVIFNTYFLIKQKRLNVFLSLVIFMSVLSGILTPHIYKFNYAFGQNDLMKFAKIANCNNSTISGYMTGKKYSLLYYGDQKQIDFQTEEDLVWLDKELDKENNIIITKNKYIKNMPVKVIEKGIKYSIVGRKDKYEKK